MRGRTVEQCARPRLSLITQLVTYWALLSCA